MNSLVNKETLELVLQKALKKPLSVMAFKSKMLQGGTVGSVYQIFGQAVAPDQSEEDFKLVLKVQKKWERFQDPLSWRREFDLYQSELSNYFSDAFSWPICYHSAINADETETHLWLEHIDGTTGTDLSQAMLEKAAFELGNFQGKIHANQSPLYASLKNLGPQNYAKNFYEHYRSWPLVYDYIRSEASLIPKHLCQMLIDFDENAEVHFKDIEKLPIVLCHRDYWVANVFFKDEKIYAIDWDTAGWGYFGEDLASLIADEADNAYMTSYYEKLVNAYYEGFSKHVTLPASEHLIFEFILLMFGYRLVEWFLHAENPEDKGYHLETLEKIYEIMQKSNRKRLANGDFKTNLGDLQ